MLNLEITSQLDSLTSKFRPSGLSKAKLQLSKKALEHMTFYVPKDTGYLRSTGKVVGDDTIMWDGAHYAHKQYYTPFRNYTTPGTGRLWDKVAKGNHMREWKKVYARGLGL